MQRFPMLPRLSLKRGQCFLFAARKLVYLLVQIQEAFAFFGV